MYQRLFSIPSNALPENKSPEAALRVHCFGVHDRHKPLTCMHSVTSGDTQPRLCRNCITDRDETFKSAVIENREALYQAVISNTALDNWIPTTQNAGNVSLGV